MAVLKMPSFQGFIFYTLTILEILLKPLLLSLLWLPLFQCQRLSGTISHLTRKLLTELFPFCLQEVMYLPSHLLVPQQLPRFPHLPQQQHLPQLCLKFPLTSWSYQALNFPSRGTVETCHWMRRIPTPLKNFFTRELCKREHTLFCSPASPLFTAACKVDKKAWDGLLANPGWSGIFWNNWGGY